MRTPGDLLLIVADVPTTAGQVLGALRLELAERFDLIPTGSPRHPVDRGLSGVLLASGRAALGRRAPPVHRADRRPRATRVSSKSRAYDLVLDGNEIGGGSIRINRPEVQRRVFEIIGIGEQEAQARFGFLLDAMRYGSPPLGGIAMGIDRIVALLAGRESIREVIAFPKAASGADPLTGAPAPVGASSAARARSAAHLNDLVCARSATCVGFRALLLQGLVFW